MIKFVKSYNVFLIVDIIVSYGHSFSSLSKYGNLYITPLVTGEKDGDIIISEFSQIIQKHESMPNMDCEYLNSCCVLI